MSAGMKGSLCSVIFYRYANLVRKSLSKHRLDLDLLLQGDTCMCHTTGANFEFWLECLVRTIRTPCIMLKIVKEPN
jgi:hypothetical protein